MCVLRFMISLGAGYWDCGQMQDYRGRRFFDPFSPCTGADIRQSAENERSHVQETIHT